jgi:hypothetical protein
MLRVAIAADNGCYGKSQPTSWFFAVPLFDFVLCYGLQITEMRDHISMMRMDQLRLLFEAGDLVNATVVTAPLEPGPARRWICEFQRRNGVREAIALNRKRNGSDQVRIFNSLDAAFSVCVSVGFRAAKVVVQ